MSDAQGLARQSILHFSSMIGAPGIEGSIGYGVNHDPRIDPITTKRIVYNCLAAPASQRHFLVY
ncbi:hypothetical protein CCAX7_45530 [Capsulimonas corticalis]|uniref:Uncharacterized protein n=1 Tax=Capsulimonas corticalis TaxID=2219043 RepID=A0A402D5Y1_9BACT|nr:hypothetical protein [Capsulimonas corticalis]BDI32502.1 hypothetical protein CCAX7_45530 [Capsulimonas corticalis]